jgi:hypothetical protein
MYFATLSASRLPEPVVRDRREYGEISAKEVKL